jgi:hypothetical protein
MQDALTSMFVASTVPPVSALTANIDANKGVTVCLSLAQFAGKPAMTKIN